MKIAVVVSVWLLFVAGGMFALERYKNSPGARVPAPPEWPADSALQRTQGSATLVMMSHPRCPCTRASLAELEILLSQYRESLTVYILFTRPKGVAYDWTNTDLWRTASRIEGAHALVDADGIESDRFGALTSGHVVLYNSDGRLEFSGGITGARGHIGDNLGLKRILALLRGEPTDRPDSPVFGCPLHSEN